MTRRGREIDVDTSAWLDGELDETRARQIEAEVASDPLLRTEVEGIRAASSALRRMVDEAEAKVDFSCFSAGVMSAIDAAEAAPVRAEPNAHAVRESPVRAASDHASLWGRIRGGLCDFFLAHRPALAAAATMLVVLGGGSFYFLLSSDTTLDLQNPVVLRGGSTVIEDLTFGDGSAVVFRTDSDVTVIWVTDD